MICEIIDGENILFPPFIRFMPDELKDTPTFAIANRIALPTGAAALAFVLIFGIFLLSITLGQINFSLISFSSLLYYYLTVILYRAHDIWLVFILHTIDFYDILQP